MTRALRATLAIVALVATAEVSLAVAIVRETRPSDAPPVEPSWQELRASLPPRGTVGYLTDKGKHLAHDGRYDDAALYSLQFQVAPVVLVEGLADTDVVVLDFEDVAAARDALARNKLVARRELAPGLIVAGRAP